jgi:hypothetical protein
MAQFLSRFDRPSFWPAAGLTTDKGLKIRKSYVIFHHKDTESTNKVLKPILSYFRLLVKTKIDEPNKKCAGIPLNPTYNMCKGSEADGRHS